MYERRREAVQCVEGIRVKLEDLEEGAGDGESFDDRDDEGEVLPASTGQSPPPLHRRASAAVLAPEGSRAEADKLLAQEYSKQHFYFCYFFTILETEIIPNDHQQGTGEVNCDIFVPRERIRP